VIIRPAVHEDLEALVGLVGELATFENSSEQVKIDVTLLGDALFGAEPSAFARVAIVDAEIVGMAIYYRTFSTWTGRTGIHLDDLYVKPDHRGRGVGRALLATLARLAVEQGSTRIEWKVLDWNERALAFYRSLGAFALNDWSTYRLSGVALDALAETAP
jgi:ribosomal protein S18 acetylase RimI-like enzyme